MKQTILPLIDCGHGINTRGKRSPLWPDGTQMFEYEFNRSVAMYLRRKLDLAGIEYRQIVTEDEDISLASRCKRANRIYDEAEGKCILISIHSNAGGGTGFEAYTTPGETEADKLAEVIYGKVAEVIPEWKLRKDLTDGDADKEANFYILKHTKCPAVLCEFGFMDNEEECRQLMTKEYREKCADVLFETIKEYCLKD